MSAMAPKLHDETFVFCTCKDNPTPIDEALMRFQEAEGATWILPQAIADRHHLPYQHTWRMITLTVHSSLEAVGFLASVLPALAREGISTNVVSAFYHDHLFVPAAQAQHALSILQSLSNSEE
jgi:hypothetical protein